LKWSERAGKAFALEARKDGMGLLSDVESTIPDWLWDPVDNWSRSKGFGRMFIFLGLVGMTVKERVGWSLIVPGVVMYGIGLLGLRMKIERKREVTDE